VGRGVDARHLAGFLGHCHRQCSDLTRACREQDLRAFIERCARRAYIIDEDDDAIVDERAAYAIEAGATGEQWRDDECAADVGMARVRVQCHLRRGPPDSPQRIDNGTPIKTCREVARLIEATPHPSPRMQRHRYDIVATFQ